MGAFLEGADLAGGDFRWTTFRFAMLGGADLSGADLRSTDFSGEMSCPGADLSNASFRAADLTHARMRFVKSVAHASFEGAVLEDVLLTLGPGLLVLMLTVMVSGSATLDKNATAVVMWTCMAFAGFNIGLAVVPEIARGFALFCQTVAIGFTVLAVLLLNERESS